MFTIRPWVGKHYAEGVHGKRLLLLGESNYHRADVLDDDYSNIVCENVQACAIEGRVRFFTKAAKLVLMASGMTDISRESIVDLWHRVLFTNYVQKVFKSDRVRPEKEDWTAGQPSLLQLLTEHRPQVVLAFGVGLGSHLGWLQDAAPYVATVCVAHPSSFGFRYDEWVSRVSDALGDQARI